MFGSYGVVGGKFETRLLELVNQKYLATLLRF